MSYDKLCVAFSLYGSDSRYSDGALKNVRLMPTVYPGAKMIVYYDSSVPDDVIYVLGGSGALMVDCSDLGMGGHDRMMWRFLAADPVSGYEYMLSRDLDSRINSRERWCLDHWLTNHPHDVLFTMQDSESHVCTPIMGGMFGCKAVFKDMRSKIMRWSKFHNKNDGGMGIDQEFLTAIVCPTVEDWMTTYAGGRAADKSPGSTLITEPYDGTPGGHVGCPD